MTPPPTPDLLTGRTVTRLMATYGKTIQGLANAMSLTQAQVQAARSQGVKGEADVRSWMGAITGDPHAGWAAVTLAYAAPMGAMPVVRKKARFSLAAICRPSRVSA